jgi:transposase-like protein
MKKREPNSSAQSTKFVRRKYDEEFKQQALTMVRNGQSVRSVAEALGISENLIHQAVRHGSGQSGAEALLNRRVIDPDQRGSNGENNWWRSFLDDHTFHAELSRQTGRTRSGRCAIDRELAELSAYHRLSPSAITHTDSTNERSPVWNQGEKPWQGRS